MADYIPPNINNLPFTFSENGYTKPDFDDVTFNFSLRPLIPSTPSVSDLQASIEVMQLYQDSTYTYIKECKTIIVGYSEFGVQTLKLPCKYGGIRDLGGTITPLLHSRDLYATIESGKSTEANLSGFIRTWYTDTSSIHGALKGAGTAYIDLNTSVIGDYIKVNLPSEVNLIYKNNLNASMLPIFLKGTLDLTAYSKTNLRNNLELSSYLNIIEIRDLPVDIIPNLLHGVYSIKAYLQVYQRSFVDLNVYFRGWDQRQLPANLSQINFSNLTGRILSTLDLDLSAYLYAVVHVDLNSSILALDYKNLKASILSTYGPTDLQTYLNSVEPKNLKGSLYSFRGLSVNMNLPATVTSLYERNLYAYLNAGGSYNLASSITASGSTKQLYAYLFPKVIHVKKAFTITLLSTKNLFCAINSSCFRTSYKNLGTSLYSYDNKNLNAYIMVGFDLGGNLPAKINMIDTICMDTIDVKFLPDKKYTSIHMNIKSAAAGLAFNTISTVGRQNTSSISAYIKVITSTATHRNLSANLTTVIDAPFTTTTSHINRFKVLDLNHKNYSNWEREIEVLFGAQAKNYRYVEANKMAYREFREHHWIISVVGFNYVPGIGVERGKVRKKYIFDLRKYNDIDEAIRDAIDRVSAFRKGNLSSQINGVISLGAYKDLTTYILSRLSDKGLTNISAGIKGISELIDFNLTSSLTGRFPLVNLLASITGKFYEPTTGDAVDFDFREKDKVVSLERDVDLNFDGGV